MTRAALALAATAGVGLVRLDHAPGDPAGRRRDDGDELVDLLVREVQGGVEAHVLDVLHRGLVGHVDLVALQEGDHLRAVLLQDGLHGIAHETTSFRDV